LDNLYAYTPPRVAIQLVRRIGDLISYQKTRKGRMIIADKG